jgi:transaldolase / glucose-6-phosphate isomerase
MHIRVATPPCHDEEVLKGVRMSSALPLTKNALQELADYGQSVWLDYIRRSLMSSGELARLIAHDGLMGMTSNPAIFEKAITGSTDYSDSLTALEDENLDAMSLYERLAIPDIQSAADALRPVYERTNFRDGYVSLEVSPFLAHDTQGTIEQARRLWKTVGRENLMVKVPATPEGIPAIEQLLSEGININITLLFAQHMYEKVAQAYISALEKRSGDLRKMASVASFFVSRIDSLIDPIAKAKLKTASPEEKILLERVTGKVAIANAKLTYARYKEIFSGPRWEALKARGAQTQRLLWASTSTKDPAYRDVLYVEELIGRDTVDTIPPATFDAFRDHGKPRASLEENLDQAQATMDALSKTGIRMDEITDRLLKDGVKLFAEAFDKLLNSVDRACKIEPEGEINPQTISLPSDLQKLVDAAMEDWQIGGKVRRLWAHDASLWTNSDEAKWLGWLSIVEDQLKDKAHLESLAAEIKRAGFKYALLLGMGGSSLCPEVLKTSFGKIDGFPELFVLDSTDPAQIRDFENKIDLANTLFIVSSKSGTTLEPNIFKQYFFERVKQTVGADKAGSRFIAITDPGSHLEKVATEDKFRRILRGAPSIGGRYSALSDFGMGAAAIMGIDAVKFLDRAEAMVVSCSHCVPIQKNPGVMLGLVLGALGKHGRDKVTLIASPGIMDLGAWLEQLIAESTGKDGKGLIPVDREMPAPPETHVYGDDRVFAYLRLQSEPDPTQEVIMQMLADAGQPVIRIDVAEPLNLGQEFFRWEIATAVAGSILGIDAFNQPDVEASKIATRKLTEEYERTGSLPPEKPFFSADGVSLFSNDANAKALGSQKTLTDYLRAHLDHLTTRDYFALLAYIEMNDPHLRALSRMRMKVRDHKRVATCLGFGPRFLHSTGQAYKGGPNTGVFLQITCSDAADLPVPGQKYTFGVVKAAQARGDFEVLAERNRRALRVHLDKSESGLKALESAIVEALK